MTQEQFEWLMSGQSITPTIRKGKPKKMLETGVNNPVNYKKIVEKKVVLWYNSGKKTYREEHHEAAFFF